MNAASEFDLGPLTWVKTEIDLALNRATEALTQYAGSGDVTHLKFARTHIHQAHGALAIVGLDGITQVTESLEALLVLLESGQSTAAGSVFDAFDLSLTALRQYLDDLLAGAPNQPLRLLPAYLALAAARGIATCHAADLFYPDLSARPVKRAITGEPVASEALPELIKRERARYQKGLLAWLKKPDETAQALNSMREALQAVEAIQDTPANRAFWWVALGFLETLALPAVATDPRARQLCSHIDAQLRRLLEGSRTVAERLLRDALYFAAQAPAGLHPLVDELQARFQLATLLPSGATQPPQPHELALRQLREALGHSEEAWNKFCAGHGNTLAAFAEQARLCAQLTGDIGHTDLKRLGQGFVAIANWLAEQPARHSDGIAMEVATTILLLQNALENFRHLGTDFAQQVDLMVARLYGCIAEKPAAGDALPALDEVTRKAQEKLLIAQVAREIQNNLAQIEQALDVFFRDPAQRQELGMLDGPLKQIAGALTMLGHLDAVAGLQAGIAQIRRFTASDYRPVTEDFETLARQLSLLGFFVDALPHGETSYESFVARLQGQPAAETVTEAVAEEAVSSAALDAEISGEPAKLPEAPAPSDETLQLAEAGHDAIDAELLAIFLMEAHDVLATLAEKLAALRTDPDHADALVTIRRGTHTLKGSGRMVGLADFGETAWELEQTLNLWLRQEQPVNDDLLRLIADEHRVFTAWVAALENHGTSLPDTAALIARARQLRGTETLPAQVAAPATPAAVAEPVPVPVTEPVIAPDAPAIADAQLNATAAALEDLLSLGDEETAALSRSTAENAAVPPTASAAPTLYDIFRDEARGHLHTLVDSLADLQSTPEAPTTFAMTRAAHTLGGIAATVGLMPINQLAIALEHALLRRDGSADPAAPDGLDTVGLAIGTLEAQFAALAEQRPPEAQAALIAALDAIYPAPPVADEPSAAAAPPPAAELAELPAGGLPELPQLTDELDEQLLPLFLDEAQDQLRELHVQLLAWRQAPDQKAAPHAIARLLHTFKGNARMAGAMNLGEFTHLLETRVGEASKGGSPAAALIDEIESGCDTLAQSVERLRAGDLPPAAPTEALAAAPAEDVAEIEAEQDSGPQRATLRVPASLVDQLVNEAGELSIARARIEGEMRSLKGSLLDLTENVIRLRRQLREIEIQAEGQIQARVANAPDGSAHFDPLGLDRFTRFQELTRFMAESVNDVATLQQNLLKNVDDANAAIVAQSRLNRHLQQELMGIRMLPFASQNERLYRIVRQTAKEVGKRAHLDIVGGQVEMDRSVLDTILAPLEHMLRNAVTHGIEPREARLAAGKPETGEITVAVVQEGNEIILAMSDDGQGLNAAAIRARAETLGLLAPDQAADEATLFDFIFQPGFSTASELSQVAGRGVGMDVVKTEVSALGGRIEIVSRPGQGSTFRLYLPLTLAVTPTLLLRAGADLYAVPSTMIEQVQELKAKALDALRARGEAEWMGHRYPFHYLPHLLGDTAAVPEASRQYWVLLLRSGSQRVAVLVDELQGNQEAVVKNIGAQLARVVGIDGATVLGDGKVVLILNPVALASRASVPAAALPLPRLPEAALTAAPALPTVMVVDDSLTVRKITSRLLAREGYQVLLAKDGVDALEQLLDLKPDVVLSDVEMPRMDGFDLVRNIRADARLHDLPIIMITSRTADKHRNYALELGANHYLGKPYDEDELLRLVAGYLPAALATADA